MELSLHNYSRRPDGTLAEGPVAVLVHGLDSFHGTWRSTVEGLAERGIGSITLDLRGHGHSPLGPPEDFGPGQLAADIQRTLRKAGALGRRFVLVGHSMGGKVAMRYAADYPEDLCGLVIEDMDCTTRTSPQDYLEPSASELERRMRFQRRFSSWAECRKELLTYGYDEGRVDGWLEESPPRVVRDAAEGGVWSCINPLAQWLAWRTVLAHEDARVALQRIAAVQAVERPDLSVHVLVAGPSGTVCSWDELPGGIHDMSSVAPKLVVTEFPDARHSIHNSARASFLDLVESVVRNAQHAKETAA